MRSWQGGELPADEFDLKIDPQKEGADTMVYKIECWGSARNYVKGLQAGTRVMVRGRMIGRRYQDKNGNWRVKSKLARLGYNAAWGVLGADAVGLLHHRARLWLVAYDASKRGHARRMLEACGIRATPRQFGGLSRLYVDYQRGGTRVKGLTLAASFVSLLMGFPQRWGSLQPMEMHKFRLWQQQHSEYSHGGCSETVERTYHDS